MESQNKEVEELPTKSTEKSLEQVLHEEEEYVFDETYMLYNRFNISDVDYEYIYFNKNLRMMIGYIQTYMVKQ